MEVSATAKYLPVSARKVRLVLEQLPGKRVDEAMMMLRFLPTPHARLVEKVVKSAASNAENNYALDTNELRIKRAYAGEARTLKRFKAKARGRVAPILRRTSHVTVVVEEG
ncbi:MAG TPA: 50S ribosomal protein L22 [Dehalococcoidia bacterium]|jgi:large subunit ribosomal protein L22|nr:50S ribosomal protein L22 [Dehalococcoidia bacterium]